MHISRHGLSFPLLASLAAFLAALPAFAGGPFQIINRTDTLGSDAASQAVRTEVNTLEDQLETTVNGILSDQNRSNLLTGMAKAGSSGDTAISADYASNPSKFVIGTGAQVGYNCPPCGCGGAFGSANNSFPAVGASAQISTLIGVRASMLGIPKLGPIDTSKLMIYGSAFSYSPTIQQTSARIFNAGLRAQYKLVPTIGTPLLASWGGIDFGTGLLYSTLQIQYKASVNQSQSTTFNVAGIGSDTATVAWKADYLLGVKTKTFTVPLEVSTNATLFYLFTVYGGGGLDLNFGSSDTTGSSSGPITVTDGSGLGTFNGTGQLSLDNTGVSASPTLAVGHFFAGVQFNLWVLKLFGQYDTLTNGTQVGAAGVKLAL